MFSSSSSSRGKVVVVVVAVVVVAVAVVAIAVVVVIVVGISSSSSSNSNGSTSRNSSSICSTGNNIHLCLMHLLLLWHQCGNHTRWAIIQFLPVITLWMPIQTMPGPSIDPFSCCCYFIRDLLIRLLWMLYTTAKKDAYLFSANCSPILCPIQPPRRSSRPPEVQLIRVGVKEKHTTLRLFLPFLYRSSQRTNMSIFFKLSE